MYFDDHDPPHVHVFKAGGQAKITIGDSSKHGKNIMVNPTLDDQIFQQQFEQAQAAAELANLIEPRALATPPGTGIAAYYESNDRTIAGLLAGRFGTKKWMEKLQQEWLQTA
jgi:Domain of unknown function (DUF4160)